MKTTFAEVFDSVGAIGDFEPCAGFHPAMDMIVILKEDVSYRSECFGPALSVLWAPQEDRLVGFKIESADFLVRSARQLLRLAPGDTVPLRTLALLAALTSWPIPLPVRHAGLLERIEAFFVDADVRDMAPAQWAAIAPVMA